MSESRVVATYQIESADVDKAAAVMAGEQSTGTFIKLESETDELLAAHAATVESVQVVGEVGAPTLAGSSMAADGRYQQARVVISFPLDNIGTSLSNLTATVAGNLFELKELSGIRLEELTLPDELIDAHPGPQFGIPGTRDLASVTDRPIIGTIIKPSVGLTPEATATLAGDLARAGLDFIKDDELMANPPHSPFDRRARAVLTELKRVAETTGRQVMYAANVTDDLDQMFRHVDLVAELGGTCVMVSLNGIGLGALERLRRMSPLPIHGHRNGWGAMTRQRLLGYSFPAYHQLWRLAGADHLHVNGLRNKFWEPDDSVLRSARACLTPLGSSQAVMPVFSSGQSVMQVHDTYTQLGSTDLMYLCGGGIIGHPSGPAAGVAALKQAWRAAIEGIPTEAYAAEHDELREAIERFGP